MSAAASWLHRQKKGDLADLADEAGLKGTSGMKKDELADALDEYLKTNATSLSRKSSLNDYYSRASPVKKEAKDVASSVAAEATKVVKRARKSVAPSDETVQSAESTVKSAAVRTPKSVQKLASRVPLPASPSTAVVDLYERQTAALTRRYNSLIKRLGAEDYATSAREYLSTVGTIQLLFVVFEAYCLQAEVLPWRKWFSYSVPFAKQLGIASTQQRYLPDFFELLQPNFWKVTGLWFILSVVLPAIGGWAFNLTRAPGVSKRHAQPIDPVAFSIVKALVAWVVFDLGVSYTLVGKEAAAIVKSALPAGSTSIYVASAVSGLAGVYEAVLKK